VCHTFFKKIASGKTNKKKKKKKKILRPHADATDASDLLIGVPPGAIAADGGSLVRHSTDGAGETDAAADATDESCPVCGMAVPDAARDRVAVRGNQAVLTCTHAHAATVLAAPAQYAAAGPGASPSASASPGGDPGKGVDSDPFCVSGSVMWPGFAWKNEVCTILLFNSVRIGSAGGLLVACLMMIVLGIMVEAIHTFRKKVVSRHYIAALVAEKHRLRAPFFFFVLFFFFLSDISPHTPGPPTPPFNIYIYCI
jgi:hypothetical protein